MPSSPPPPNPLERAAKALAGVLPTRDVARRWFDAAVAALGEGAVVDTAERGALRWVARRERGGRDLLPAPALVWSTQGRRTAGGFELLEVLELYDGRQKIGFVYAPEGPRVESSTDARWPGRLPELAGLLSGAKDGFEATLRFVVGLDDARFGPGRVHYPVPVPGGLRTAWHVGLSGCRRALHAERVEAGARFLVADGLEGRATGWGVTREEALAAYAAEVARELPRQRYEEQFANDDYDDDGNLLKRGSLEGMFGEQPPLEEAPAAGSYVEGAPPEPEIDPITGAVELTGGPMRLRGPSSDAPPVPARPECVPHVLIPLEASPASPPPAGRWVRLLGEQGVTRHAVRLKDGDGFLLVGADLLGHVDLRTLRADLDRIDAEAAERGPSIEPMFPQYTRYRTRLYAWRPESAGRPAGLHDVGQESGPRFDAAGLDGDRVQGQVRRQQRVRRPATGPSGPGA